MQGRLSPPKKSLIQHYPVDTWKSEFSHAAKLGLDCIEWVFEYPNYDKNALFLENGARIHY